MRPKNKDKSIEPSNLKVGDKIRFMNTNMETEYLIWKIYKSATNYKSILMLRVKDRGRTVATHNKLYDVLTQGTLNWSRKVELLSEGNAIPENIVMVT